MPIVGRRMKRKGNWSQYWKGKKLSAEHIRKRSETRSKNAKHRWKDKDGYIMVFKPTHPNSRVNGYVYEHRLIMEDKIGRYLYKKEQVHHINGIKDDNRIKNLKLFKDHKAHHRYHWVEMRSRKFCCPSCGGEFRLEEITHVTH